MTATSQPWLVARARESATGTALLSGDRQLCWSDLATDAEAVAAGLVRLGVVRGDIVAARMSSQPRTVSLLHALQMLGAAMMPLHTRLAAGEIARLLLHARPRLLVDDGSAGNAATFEHDLRVVHPADAFGNGRVSKSLTIPGRIDPSAALTLVPTSGTSGGPKCVVLTNANHAASAAASRRRLGHDSQDRWLATLPLFHVGGLAILARAVLDGSSVELASGFDETFVAEVLSRGSATIVPMVPAMLARVLDKCCAPVSPRLRCVLIGGASLAPALAARAHAAGLPVCATYGMTEACSQICTSEPGSDAALRGTVGKPLEGIEVRIVPFEDAGDAAHRDGSGEILVRGANVMRGYVGNPDASARALRDGWLVTGDFGRIDAHGDLVVGGRCDDIVITGGENVAPNEVETVLDAHPDIAESLVIGVADEDWGQRLTALIVPRRGTDVSLEQIRQWCRGRIAGYKIPREVRVVDALPRNAMGKLVRRAVN